MQAAPSKPQIPISINLANLYKQQTSRAPVFTGHMQQPGPGAKAVISCRRHVPVTAQMSALQWITPPPCLPAAAAQALPTGVRCWLCRIPTTTHT